MQSRDSIPGRRRQILRVVVANLPAHLPQHLPGCDHEVFEAEDVEPRRICLREAKGVLLVQGPAKHVVRQGKWHGPALRLRVGRPRIAHHAQHMRPSKLVEDARGIDGDDRAVADVDRLFGCALKVLPRFEGRLEESSHIVGARSSSLFDHLHVDVAPLIVRHHKLDVAELAHVRSPGADLCLLVDDRPIVVLGPGVEGKDRPPVLDRENR